MELIIYMVMTVSFVATLAGLIRFFLKKQKELLETYERCMVTPENPILPEAHIMRFAPVPITLHGKTIYLQPLSAQAHAIYSKKMLEFLLKYQKQLAGLRFALIKDLMSKESSLEALQSWTGLQNNAELVKDMQYLIYSTFLKQKNCNPNKISKRFIYRNWTWVETLQVWQMMWLIQTKSVEDFIQYLLESQGGSDKWKTGSPFTKSAGTGPTRSAHGLLTPRYSSVKGPENATKDSKTSIRREVD